MGQVSNHIDEIRLKLLFFVVYFGGECTHESTKHRLLCPHGVMPIHLRKHRVSSHRNKFRWDFALFVNADEPYVMSFADPVYDYSG